MNTALLTLMVTRLLYGGGQTLHPAPAVARFSGSSIACVYLTARETRARGLHASMCVGLDGTGGGVLQTRTGVVRCSFRLALVGSCLRVDGCGLSDAVCA